MAQKPVLRGEVGCACGAREVSGINWTQAVPYGRAGFFLSRFSSGSFYLDFRLVSLLSLNNGHKLHHGRARASSGRADARGRNINRRFSAPVDWGERLRGTGDVPALNDELQAADPQTTDCTPRFVSPDPGQIREPSQERLERMGRSPENGGSTYFSS